MIIRKYQSKDRKAVEFIQLSTYRIGKPIQPLMEHPEKLNKDVKYYFEQEPQSCYVAVSNGKVVGYLLGCLDDKNHEESIYAFVGAAIIALTKLPFIPSKDRKFYWGRIKVIFLAMLGKSAESKFKPPKDSGHIHINLLPEARGKGVGTRLLKMFFKYAKLNGVKRIHADSFQTRLNPNKNFWLKNGFKEYLKVKTSMWRAYYPDEDIKLICYVKNL